MGIAVLRVPTTVTPFSKAACQTFGAWNAIADPESGFFVRSMPATEPATLWTALAAIFPPRGSFQAASTADASSFPSVEDPAAARAGLPSGTTESTTAGFPSTYCSSTRRTSAAVTARWLRMSSSR